MKLKFFLVLAVMGLIYCGSMAAERTRPVTDSLPVLNRVAPDFSLKDINGNLVSLSSFKGKTVVLDFWATWCYYCHLNFPAMQIAINHYQKNSDVVFLFIDTRERVDDVVPAVKKDLKKHGYQFRVLLDEKGSEGLQNKYYKIYEMAGIPTRFIIDTNGIIRYKLEGHYEKRTDDENAAEIIALIDKTIAMKN